MPTIHRLPSGAVFVDRLPADGCARCGFDVGGPHELYCTLERCPFCGGQLATCDCIVEQLGLTAAQRRVVEQSVDDSVEPLKGIMRRWERALTKKGRIPVTAADVKPASRDRDKRLLKKSEAFFTLVFSYLDAVSVSQYVAKNPEEARKRWAKGEPAGLANRYSSTGAATAKQITTIVRRMKTQPLHEDRIVNSWFSAFRTDHDALVFLAIVKTASE